MSDYLKCRKQEEGRVVISELITTLVVIALVVVGAAVVEADDSIESQSATADHLQNVSQDLRSDQKNNLSDFLVEVAAVADKYSGGLPTKVKDLIHHSLSQGVHHLTEAGGFIVADMPTYTPPRLALEEVYQEDASKERTDDGPALAKGESRESASGIVAGVQSDDSSSSRILPLLTQSVSELTGVVNQLVTSRPSRGVANNVSTTDDSAVTKTYLEKRLDDLRSLMYRNDESVMDASDDDYDHPDDISLDELTVGEDAITDFTGSNLSVSDGVLNASGGGGGSASAASSSGAVQFSGGSGDLRADADNFFWDDSNNRLGIGTATPAASLDVAGITSLSTTTITDLSASSTDIDTLTVEDAEFTDATTTNFFASAATFTSGIFDTITSTLGDFTNLEADNATTTSLIATDATTTNLTASGDTNLGTTTVSELATFNGGVGIGTSNPDSVLDIQTNSSDDVLNLKDSAGNTFASFSTEDKTGTSTGNFTLYDNGYQSPLNSIFAIHQDKDDIYMSKFYNHAYSTQTPVFTYFAWDDGRFVQSTESDAPLQFSTNGYSNVRLHIDGGGNVGIGNTNPASVLDVDGDITSSGILDVNGTGTSTIESDIDIAGSILPRSDSVYNLGAPNLQWKDVYISSGSLYIDGQRVLGENNGGAVTVSADDDQNINIKTSGTGDIQLNPSGSGSANIINGNFGVGIGTSTPVTTLEVGGTTTADAISVGGDAISGFTGSNLSVSGGILSSTDTTLTEDETESFIFDADNTGTLSSGTLDFSSLSFSGTLSETEIDESSLDTADFNNDAGFISDPNDAVDGSELDNLFSQNGFLERTGAGSFQATSTIDISDDTNLTASAGASLTGDDISVDDVDTLSTGLTSGSLVFSDGSTLAEDNANLFWDDANSRLGVGTTTPTTILDVVGDGRITGTLDVEGTGTSTVEDSLHVKDDIAVGTNSTTLSGSSLNFGGAGTISVNNGLDISGTDVSLGEVSSGVPQDVRISGLDATQDNTDGGDMIFEASSGLGESTSGSFVFKTGNNTPKDIAFDNSSTGNDYATGVSFSHSVGTDRSDRILIAGVSIEETGDVTSVTYGGQNMTKLADVNAGTGFSEIGTDLWYLLDPPTGSNTVSISTDLGSSEYIMAGAASYYGVNQSNPFDTAVTGKDWSGASEPSVDVTSDTGDLVVDVVGMSYVSSVGSGQTQRWASDYGSENHHSTEPGGGTVTMSWSGSGEWSQIGVAMNPVEIPSDQPMSLVDALRISPDGSVGVGGVGNPNHSLHAAGGAAAQRVLATSNGSETDLSFGWEGTGAGMFYNDTNNNRSIDFVLDGTTEASLNSYSLSVGSGSLNETGVSTIDGKIGGISNYNNTPNSAFGANASAPFAIDTDRYNNNNAEGWDFFITQDGNVSIGTSSPSSLLDVAGTTTSQTLAASSTETDTLTANSFSIAGDTITDFVGSGLSLSSNVLGVNDAETLSTGLTAGSIPFSDGSTLTGSNTNLFWDDANNRLGIGTNSPGSALEVNGDALFKSTTDNEEAFRFEVNETNHQIPVSFENTGTSSMNVGIIGQPGEYTLFNLRHGDASGDGFNVGIDGSDPGDLVFIARNGSNNEVMRVTNSGNVGIGTSTPDTPLEVAGAVRQSNATNCELAANVDGDLICSGTSDETLKTDINELDAQDALSQLSDLEGKTFRFRPEAKLGDKEEIGFIAQEVEEVFPKLVGESNGHKYVRYDRLTPLLTEAVKEVDKKVDRLEESGNYWADDENITSNGNRQPTSNFIAAVGATLEDFASDIKARFDELFADRVVAEEELCIGDTCVNESELQTLLEQRTDTTNDETSTDDDNTLDPKDEDGGDGSTDESTASSTDETSTTTEETTSDDSDSTESDETSTTTESTDDSTDETSTTTEETTEGDTSSTTDSTTTDDEGSTTNEEEDGSTTSSTDSTDETSTSTSSE